jgi:hypothetical protein
MIRKHLFTAISVIPILLLSCVLLSNSAVELELFRDQASCVDELTAETERGLQLDSQVARMRQVQAARAILVERLRLHELTLEQALEASDLLREGNTSLPYLEEQFPECSKRELYCYQLLMTLSTRQDALKLLNQELWLRLESEIRSPRLRHLVSLFPQRLTPGPGQSRSSARRGEQLG